MKVVCIIPTYNEKENLVPIVTRIQDLYPDIHILIVDDNSPDGTGEIADSLKSDKFDVLHRVKKEGLGRAYLAGFSKALDDGADIIIQMDADFSHDPIYIKDLLNEIKVYDVVIGSRYVKGISVIHWPLSRIFLSYFGNIYARTMTGLGIQDLTGGFKCIRRKVLESVNFKRIKTNGYSFQVEMNYAFYKNGFSLKEVPIIFAERIQGDSKMNKKIVIEAILRVPFFRFKNY